MAPLETDEDEESPEREGGKAAEARDAWQMFALDVFRYLRVRSCEFGDSYPFRLDDQCDTIFVRAEGEEEGSVYLFLLMCSGLRYVSIWHRVNLTHRFEQLCGTALRKALPPPWSVSVFGTSSGAEQGQFRGKAWTKVQRLAAILGERTACAEDDFDPKDVGDKGLDIVALCSFEDELPGKLLVLGQCACTDEWVPKQFSATELRWRRLINFSMNVITVTFVPFHLRESDGRWTDRLDLVTVRLDRGRILKLVGDGARLESVLPDAVEAMSAASARRSEGTTAVVGSAI